MSESELVAQQLVDSAQLKNIWGKSVFNVKDIKYGAKGDDKTDDIISMNKVVQDAKINKGIVYFPSGTYRFKSTWVLDGLDTVAIVAAPGALLNFEYIAASTTNVVDAIRIVNSKIILFKGLTINILNQQQLSNGLHVQSSSFIYVEETIVNGAKWVCFTISDAVDFTSHDIFLYNCRFEWGRYGIYTNADGLRIEGCYISNHWSQTIEATSQGPKPIWKSSSLFYDGLVIKGKNIVITKCTIEDNGQSGIYSGGVSRLSIDGCIIRNNWNKGIDMGATRNTEGDSSIQFVIASGNICENNKTGNIHFNKVDYSVVNGNQSLNTDATYADVPTYAQPCILFNNDCKGNTVTGNTIFQIFDTTYGIFANNVGLNKSADNSFINNIVTATKPYKVGIDQNVVIDKSNGTTTFKR